MIENICRFIEAGHKPMDAGVVARKVKGSGTKRLLV
jgi:hypothetical protein